MNAHPLIEEYMEYSLTNKQGKIIQFNTLIEMFDYIKKYGELDGWVIRVHHM